jgi:hypothetical protein
MKRFRSIWNRGLLLFWYRLWIRKNEFHKSLAIDPWAVIDMPTEWKEAYYADLTRRRTIAHERDLGLCKRTFRVTRKMVSHTLFLSGLIGFFTFTIYQFGWLLGIIIPIGGITFSFIVQIALDWFIHKFPE